MYIMSEKSGNIKTFDQVTVFNQLHIPLFSAGIYRLMRSNNPRRESVNNDGLLGR